MSVDFWYPSGQPIFPFPTFRGILPDGDMSYPSGEPMCRVRRTDTTNGGSGYTFAYAYNVGGFLEQQTFQNSGRALTYCYDDVGRVSSVTGKTGASTPYASLPEAPSGGYPYSYAPHGAVAQITLGNGLVEQAQFNSRLQTCAIRAGATPLSASSSCPSDLSGMAGGLLYLVLAYGATGNNGNLQSQQIGVTDPNAQSLSWAQAYGYDTLNRLSSATETLQSALPGLPSGVNADNWTLIEGTDDRGNHWETASAGSPTPTAASQFDRSTNRVRFLNDVNGTAMPADAYDPAGNLRDHPYIGQMQYDGENRLAQYVNGGITAQYTYDGDGHRVGRVVTGTSPSSTTYVYDAAGQLAAEYSTAAAMDAGTTYLTADHLGSTRLVTDGSQKPVHRFDYMPFGQDLSAYGNRNLVASYRALGVPAQEFTGKERDAETGLDYFGARYFSGVQGRFTSADPTLLSVNAYNPQSWNRYSYVLNNPLKFIDPLGLWELDPVTEKDKKGKTVVHVYARKSKKDDDAASLAKQLGLKGKDAENFAKKAGTGNDIRLSTLSGKVGSVYSAVESGLTEQVNYTGKSGGPGHSDCSRTAAEIGFGQNFMAQMSTNVLDALLGQQAKPESPGDAMVGDVVRYADAKNGSSEESVGKFRLGQLAK
jgi:RHS repeat-associated protein